MQTMTTCTLVIKPRLIKQSANTWEFFFSSQNTINIYAEGGPLMACCSCAIV